ncbi:arginine--tRNA ligase [Neobittarella massiliensis]|uniref:Arginine--tRNA ligase n=2 Tax=Oscillospiraceae TaxID=216572 RepID=A0A8J6LY78_9FIRM|nr:arginine--tRNA ligase [Neobittarella massiliensis]MBC3514997.1 arginine--tRNA ligase [Neobittarella massiliensis]SCJ67682.1 Arginine--tRNA ligase [uncultured Anaerotruncus sp.]
MSNLVKQAKLQVAQIVSAALAKAMADGALPEAPLPDFAVEIPADTAHGDFACNAAMVGARTFKRAPRQIADAIVAAADLSGTFFDRCEVAGPGFLNFFLNGSWFSQSVLAVRQEGDHYGRSDMGQGQKAMVEFVSANPTGPMHLGNARGGALGDCLASVLDWAGYQVTREFYINDAGNQIEKFGKSLAARYLQIYKGEENVEFPEDGYQGEDIKQRAREYADLYGDKLVDCTPEERSHALVDYALPLNIQKLKDDLAKYRIHYDVWFKESVLHQNGSVQKIVDLMKERGLTYEKEGAIWYKATEYGAEKDDVLVRANGVPTYFTADIAYHYNKFAERGFDWVVNVWGADHHGHVARLKGAMDAVGLDGSKLDVVLMQMVRLMRGGEVARMSKRTGKAISLVDLLDEIPVDAARFFFNQREPNTHCEFDLDLAIKNSSENPVYYVQYAHARICSILKALSAEGVTAESCTPEQLALLSTEQERALIRHLAGLTDCIEQSAKALDPSKMTKYCLETATLFHKFYNACRVKGEAHDLLQARLNLCLATKQVLANVLRMLGITAPESM